MNWIDTPKRVFWYDKKNRRDREFVSDLNCLFGFHQPLVTTLPLSQCEVCVIVPVRNEAETLESTLLALYDQFDLTGNPLDRTRYEIVLLANNCSDNSAAIARNFAASHPDFILHVVEQTFPAAEAYIGRVRQVLMDEAYYRLSAIGGARRVIASTDGDSRVTPTWITAILEEIASGADAVGGRIITDREGRTALDAYTRACHLREVGYRFLIAELETYLDPDPIDTLPRHFQHYGASLAVTVEMYAQAGGMQPVRTPEDVAFYQALLRVNARFRHSTRVRVFTSARTTGRTDIGLANQLSKWIEMGRSQQQFLVESAAEVEARYEWRHQLKELWWSCNYDCQPTHTAIAIVANALGVNWHWLMLELAQPQTFNCLWERVEQRQQVEAIWRQRWQLVPIEVAISELRIRLEKLRHQPKRSRVKSQKLKKSSRVGNAHLMLEVHEILNVL